jgi:hypothetical protein
MEGECALEGPWYEYVVYSNSLIMRRVNIGTKDKHKFANIGDNWNNETVEKILNLLREYWDMFPTTFSEMKGIVGESGEMRIPLKPDAKTVRQRPYRFKSVYKQKAKAEIDMMLEVGIIEHVVESEWIIPMVVQDKKIGGIIICVDLRKLNDSCLHDPFPTSFTDELLENVGGHESYSFIDGFSRYHQIKIAKEERYKTTFMT